MYMQIESQRTNDKEEAKTFAFWMFSRKQKIDAVMG